VLGAHFVEHAWDLRCFYAVRVTLKLKMMDIFSFANIDVILFNATNFLRNSKKI